MGFRVPRPWGDSDRYDFVVEAGGRFLRVQVKSAHRVCAQAGGGYHFRAHPHERQPYRADEIDLLVAYVVPENIWYVFPPSAFQNMRSMRLFPHTSRKTSKFERYREAWSLLRDPHQPNARSSHREGHGFSAASGTTHCSRQSRTAPG